ncbi:unnamed protein product [Caenorhabditis auriculariae]|uniref:Peptidase S54 rhomboid domain-containing protein n=1 Tax=Caenorhabditis auriculariae TaxID=2777116 RepID=A0A8S1H1I9_9PELO|nr:unnamed protein product [Caenorhabditis auriculariae]
MLINLAAQVFIGIPLELVYSGKAILLYCGGVVSGALLSAALDGEVFLAGAAGGVFAIVISHLLTLIVFYDQMEFVIPRVVFVSAFAAADFVVAVFQRHYTNRIDRVSFMGHIGGMVAGILLTFVLLSGQRKRRWQIFSFWASIVAYAFFVIICFILAFYPEAF